MFKVGDRVILNSDDGHHPAGSIGTITNIYEFPDWDRMTQKHPDLKMHQVVFDQCKKHGCRSAIYQINGHCNGYPAPSDKGWLRLAEQYAFHFSLT
jgi:hypothetical protein